MNLDSKVILAFDFGLKHIGVAIGQEITNTAETFFSLEAKNGEPDWSKLDPLVKEWNPKLLVVGNPLNMDGSSGKSSQSANDFAKNLSKNITIPISLWDERLSSEGTFKITKELGTNVSKRVRNLDKNAAAFILQGAIDYLSN